MKTYSTHMKPWALVQYILSQANHTVYTPLHYTYCKYTLTLYPYTHHTHTPHTHTADLTKESSDEGLPDVEVVVSAGELCTGATQTEAVHDTRQLFADSVGQLERPVAYEVVVAPLGIFIV